MKLEKEISGFKLKENRQLDHILFILRKRNKCVLKEEFRTIWMN
jgi:hypothetical protein